MGESPADPVRRPDGRVLGRERELERLRAFISGDGRPGCLVLAGDAGVGKTTLWDEGLAMAREAGTTVLWTRAGAAEMSMSFTALRDLLDAVNGETLAALPSPQLHAIEVAIRRADPGGAAPDQLAISAGLLGTVRLLAQMEPLLIAVDDAQWLDASSEDALTFVARRLESEPARFLLCRRTQTVTKLEAALHRAGVERLDVAGLSVGAIGQLLFSRLGIAPPRRVLRQLCSAARGNPLVALELGRFWGERDPLDLDEELPTAMLDDDLFGVRVQRLQPLVGRTLLAVALSGGLSRSDLESLVDPVAVKEAEASGLLVVERGRVSPTHPLLAAAARHQSTSEEREEMHRQLAVTVTDPLLRAHHEAAACVEPDGVVAAAVAAAVHLATERGAADEAEDLARQALRLTPLEDEDRPERILTLARCHFAVGDQGSARTLLVSHMEELPAGRLRAQGRLLLGLAGDHNEEMEQLELALSEAGDPDVRADALARKALLSSIARVHRIDQAEAWAREAFDLARDAEAEVKARVLGALGWTLTMRGKEVIETDPQAGASAGWGFQNQTIDRPRGVRAAFRGEIGLARRLFLKARHEADSLGDLRAVFSIDIQLCELDVRRGSVLASERSLERLHQWWDPLHEETSPTIRLGAVTAAIRGDADETHRLAALLSPGDDEMPDLWDAIEATRARGICALYEGEPAEAVRFFGQVWDLSERERVDDPGAFPVAGDLVEALVLAGDMGSAFRVSNRLLELATEQNHPWGLTMAGRCEALLRLSETYDEAAAERLGESARRFERLELGFDSARTYLMLGKMLRRYKRSGAARMSLERAVRAFEALGCTGWAESARRELSRIGGRRPRADNELTPSEGQVVELAAGGLSNKEIAQQLFISVYTVEEHLSHAYAKLGVRSRSQLPRGGDREKQ